ncbi:MAG: hypothetical protein AW06_004305 [Candidatus Accumulibacter cognatus]|uniref:Uncharacterized protein n=1 Tax=Candidatus Accumulibacter cognatus TaxID=2954383 RepID=A0A080MC70_9PROT|nr:MAG: hypothetical protein AW06_004305 [Candidatus Accumulibacter cognatus]
MVVGFASRQPGGDQRLAERLHLGRLPAGHVPQHIEIDGAVENAEHRRAFAQPRRQPAQRQLGAGQQRMLALPWEAPLHRFDQFDQRGLRRRRPAFAQRRREQRERARVPMHGVDQRLDLGALRLGGVAHAGDVEAERAFDELHGVGAAEPFELEALRCAGERHRQRFAAGEDDARLAAGEQPRSETQDLVGALAFVGGERAVLAGVAGRAGAIFGGGAV